MRGDVGDHPIVGGRGGGQNRHSVAEVGDERADTPVVGTEIVAPVRYTVRFVHDDETRVACESREHLIAEVGVVEPFRTDEQDVDITGPDPFVDLVPLRHIAGVDGRGPHTCSFGGGDLVAHQCQQWGHDHRRAVSVRPQQFGGDEIDGGFSPTGALDHECPAALDDERLDRGPLVVAQAGVRSGKLSEEVFGVVAQTVGGDAHCPIVPDITDSYGGTANRSGPPSAGRVRVFSRRVARSFGERCRVSDERIQRLSSVRLPCATVRTTRGAREPCAQSRKYLSHKMFARQGGVYDTTPDAGRNVIGIAPVRRV